MFRHWEVGHGGMWVQTLGGRAWRDVCSDIGRYCTEGCGFRHWEIRHGGMCVQTLGGRAWRDVCSDIGR